MRAERGSGLVLQNDGRDDLTVSADGSFTFATPLADGSAYDVTVLTQPTSPDQSCTVANGSGTLAGGDVTDVQVTCATITLGLSTTDLALGPTLIGSSGIGTVTLTNTGTPDLIISGISSPASPFSLSGGSCLALPITLAAGESCKIEISFAPTAIGSASVELVSVPTMNSLRLVAQRQCRLPPG